jgi:hypothetical protein
MISPKSKDAILRPLVLSVARSAESKDAITIEMRPSTEGSLRDPSAQDERIRSHRNFYQPSEGGRERPPLDEGERPLLKES